MAIENLNSFSREIKFRITKSWKTNLPEEIIITTGRGDGDCGFAFEVGKEYIVYAYGDKQNISTNICSRTSSIVKSEDMKILNKIYKRKN